MRGMRRIMKSIPWLLTILVASPISCALASTVKLVAQQRGVDAYAYTYWNGYRRDDQGAHAPDYGPFDSSVQASVGCSPVFGVGATANQTSTSVASNTVTSSGRTSAGGDRCYSSSSAGSEASFMIRFLVEAPCTYNFQGQVWRAGWSGGGGSLALTGAAGDLARATLPGCPDGSPCQVNRQELSVSGSLEPGTYVLETHAFANTFSLGGASAQYSFSLELQDPLVDVQSLTWSNFKLLFGSRR